MPAFSFLDLDFGSRRHPPRPASVVFLAATAFAAVYTLAPAVSAYRTWQTEKAAHDALAARIRRASNAGSGVAKASPRELQQFHDAMLVSSRLRAPWPDLLKVLESVPMEDIALLSVEPLAARGQLRLSAEAKNMAAMLGYLAFLQAQPALRHATLVSHQVQRQTPGSPVRFQIQAQWGGQ